MQSDRSLTSVFLWRGKLSSSNQRELELLARLLARTRCAGPVPDTRKCIKEASMISLSALRDDPGALTDQPLTAPPPTKAPNGLSFDPADYSWNRPSMILM